ncbi:MAG: NAD-binding protein [Deltaproteobacteria bacterium]|nr:NAD-binding protein [Myxococcales bacterium]MDP3218008.1 NAD-binding protein [Deltaproteobacteria bacterium]
MSARHPARRGRWRVTWELTRQRVAPVAVAFLTLAAVHTWLVWLAERDAPDTKLSTLADAAWFGVVTLATVGYGDIYPVTALGRTITGVFILLTLTTIGFLLTAINDAVAEVRRMEREGLIGTTLSGHVLVCGFGDIARTAVVELLAADRKVALLCGRPDEIAQARELGDDAELFVTSGNATQEVLDERLNARLALSAVVAFNDDTSNIVATLNLRAINPDLRVVVAVHAPELRKTLISSGVTYVASPSEFSGRLVASAAFEPEVARMLEDVSTGADGFDLRQYSAAPFAGRTVTDARAALLDFDGPLLVGLARATGTTFEVLSHPKGDLVIAAADHLLVLTDGVQAKRLADRWPSRQGR